MLRKEDQRFIRGQGTDGEQYVTSRGGGFIASSLFLAEIFLVVWFQ